MSFNVKLDYSQTQKSEYSLIMTPQPLHVRWYVIITFTFNGKIIGKYIRALHSVQLLLGQT